MNEEVLDEERLIHLATHFLDINQPEKSIQYLEQISGDVQFSPLYFYTLARAYLSLGNCSLALDAVQKGLEEQPSESYLLHLASHCTRQSGPLSLAESYIIQAIYEDPEISEYYLEYAIILMSAYKFEIAEKYIFKALELEPNCEAALNCLIALTRIYRDSKKTSELADYILEINPESSVAHLFLSQLYLENGSYTLAKKHCVLLASSDPGSNLSIFLEKELRIFTHWLYKPILLIEYLGLPGIWFLAIGISLALFFLKLPKTALWFLVLYAVYCIYTWIVPWFLRKCADRRYI